MPLQNISVNSPRKPSSAEPLAKTSTEHFHSLDGPPEVEKNFQDNPPETKSAAHETSSHTKNESPAPLPTPQPPLRPQAEWTADLASLMEKQHQRRPSSEHDKNPAQRLKHRKLGRAISGISLGNRTNDAQQLHHQDTNGSKENSFSESPEDPSAAAASHEADLPSTQIGYETLETEAARKSMAKLMGKEYSDESVGTRLASLGTVRDSGAGSGAAGGGGRSRTTRPRN